MVSSSSRSQKVQSWEITLPIPLVLSSSISDEDIISEMASASSDVEVSSILSSAFETASQTFIVSCSKDDLFDLLALDEDSDFKIEIQEYDDLFIVVVIDAEENVVGRGEISLAGKKVKKETFREAFLENFIGFQEIFNDGQKRMNNLIYKLKALQSGLAAVSKDKIN